ncbi:organic cation transporter protein-like isoform X1 [Ptychodera flava]|uniref:organic cation transporter protein-like isoform X1 n=1 Tax=Ptychodera flava TaxID=63121 RepID=UPI00396A9052
MLQFDDVLRYVLGEFGTYQKFCFLLLGLTSLSPVLQTFAPVYIQAETDHWCVVPGAENISELLCQNATHQVDCDTVVKTRTIPHEVVDDGCVNVTIFSQCERFHGVSMVELLHPFAPSLYANSTIPCDLGWEYDRSQYKSTVTQQFDLVCDRHYLNAMSTSIFMVGNFFGNTAFGLIMDKYGRMPGLLINVMSSVIFGVIQAFPVNYVMFAVTRFLLLLCCDILPGFVLATEFVGPSRRSRVGMMYCLFYSVGYMLLTLLAYFIREWWILQLVISLPNLLLLTYWWIIPESPRWLLSVGENAKADKIIRKIGKVNKVDVPTDLFDGKWRPLNDSKQEITRENSEQPSPITLLRLPNLRKKTLILCYIWMIDTIVYFGISYNTSALSGDDYVNAFLSALVEIPAYLIGIWMMDFRYFGRRWSVFITLMLSGLGCTCAVLVPTCGNIAWLEVTFAMVGKFAITASYGMIYVYSVELFPTPVRSIGVGVCSTSASLGGLLAPQLLLLKKYWKPLPFVAFGVTSLTAAMLTLQLPETRSKKLPETLEEGEQQGRKSSRTEKSRRLEDIETTAV